MAAIEVWGPRTCSRCDAQPGEHCKSSTGRKASLPHRERWPEGPPRTHGKDKAKKLERTKQRALDNKERERLRRVALQASLNLRTPLDRVLRGIVEERQEAFRRKQPDDHALR